jgi:hypothetical protein
MTWLEWFEFLSYLVTVVGLPFAVITYVRQEQAERENEDEETYLLLANAYNDFLNVVLQHSDLHLRTTSRLENPSAEQHERMLVIFDMLVSLFERAYLVAYKTDMTPLEQRRWNSWDDYMREWCARDHFFDRLPELLRGEDPDFQSYIRRVADEVRCSSASQ